MSKTLPTNDFQGIKNTSKFDEYSIKGSDESSDKGYLLAANIVYPKQLQKLHSDLSFLP